MKHRRFGRLGWRVSEVSLGTTWLIEKDNTNRVKRVLEAVHRSLDLGVNFIDTAPTYSNIVMA